MVQMMKTPIASFDQALAGRIAGVQVSSNEGMPGSTFNIVVRGTLIDPIQLTSLRNRRFPG